MPKKPIDPHNLLNIPLSDSTRIVCVSVPIRSYGRKLWKPANANAEQFMALMTERETFRAEDLETIESLGFDVRVIFDGQSSEGAPDWKVSK